MSKLESNKKIAILIVDLVSRMYKLGDGVLVEFEPSSKFPNADVTARTTNDYRIIFNIDRLTICLESEVYVTAFHEMRHIYQYCCIDLSDKFPDVFNGPKERIEKWKHEFENYYVSNVETEELQKEYPTALINPIGYWTGGSNVDSGATNRKLGSDMADSVTGGGLHGKDTSKADVSVNIYAFLKAQKENRVIELSCAIGDEFVDGKPYSEIVEIARNYIESLGGFEEFAKWGLVR